MTKLERSRIRLCVVSDVKLEERTTLVPGKYVGRVTQIGYLRRAECMWLPKKYFVEVADKQIAGAGGRASRGRLRLYDVTHHVAAGLIRVK